MIQLQNILRVALLILLTSMTATSAFAEAQIRGLKVVDTGNGSFVLKIEFSEPLTSAPATFAVNTPPRIAFDFSNVSNGLGKSIQDFSDGDLRSANIIQVGNRTRIILNLNQMLSYDSKVDGNSLLVNLRGKVAALVESNKTGRFAEPVNSSQKHSLNNIDFRRGKSGEGRVQVDLSDASTGIDIRRQGSKLVVDFLKTSLPTNLRHKLDVVDFGTSVESVDAVSRGENVQMVIEPKGAWEYSAYQADRKFIVEIRALVNQDAGKDSRSGKPNFNGARLSLNLQNISVREALNVIADFTDNNMVISDTVTGNITLRLKEVPWDQALSIILQTRGLDYRKSGNVIQVAPRDELAAKEKVDLTSRNEIAALEDVRTESIQINYAKAAEIRVMLVGTGGAIGATGGLISKRGSVTADIRTNTLFIQETPSRLDDIREMIRKIDVPMRQVMIESRVVIASNKFGRSLGSKLNYNSTSTFNLGGGVQGSIGGGTVANGALAGAVVTQPNVNLPAAGAAGTFSMLLFNSSMTKMLGLELSALETDNQGKVISSPRVLTMDQKPATIAQGVKIPYTTPGTATTPAGTSFIDANLSLMVTPQITPDDHVIMDVTVTKDSPQAVANGTPPIDTNRVQTQALVENGGTIVIGGVYQQDNSIGTTKVPLLGDLPVLGYLFRSRTSSDNKTELLIFITPKIIKDAMDLN
jgi:type IV pilus assembly protein PilQ